jgi:hypothetical protein
MSRNYRGARPLGREVAPLNASAPASASRLSGADDRLADIADESVDQRSDRPPRP